MIRSTNISLGLIESSQKIVILLSKFNRAIMTIMGVYRDAKNDQKSLTYFDQCINSNFVNSVKNQLSEIIDAVETFLEKLSKCSIGATVISVEMKKNKEHMMSSIMEALDTIASQLDSFVIKDNMFDRVFKMTIEHKEKQFVEILQKINAVIFELGTKIIKCFPLCENELNNFKSNDSLVYMTNTITIVLNEMVLDEIEQIRANMKQIKSLT